MKNILYILILIAIISLFNPVIQGEAASCTNSPTCTPPSVLTPDGCSCTYVLLSPLPSCTGTEADGCKEGQLTTFDPTGDNKIGGYLNLMIKLFIGICAVLSVVMIVAGGIEYMTSELPGLKSDGKEKIIQAILGLLLALGAWTLLNTINPDLLKSDLESLTAVTVEVAINDSIPQTYNPTTKKYINGATYGTPWNDTVGKIQTLPAGVTTNTGECSTVGQPGCTSTRGLNLSAVNTIKNGCNCQLIITAGTEFWLHGGKTGNTSHQVGSSTVDLRPNPALNAYLSGGKPLVKMTRYPPPNGPNLYEGNHWHVGT